MKRFFHSFAIALGLLTAITLVGCNGAGDNASQPGQSSTATDNHDDHSHDDHDHEGGDHDHAAHEHPAHGLNGGHMIKLEDGSEIEVALSKEDDSFAVFSAGSKAITGVKMISKIEEKETTYDFVASDTAELEGAFVLTSPELATAVRMGDAVTVTLVVETEDGAVSTRYQHHEH